MKKDKIVEIISRVEIKECERCRKFISKKEFDNGEGACYECWDNPKELK